ncbi:MAG: beta-galactosidase, partial [Planctomycetota bacterium]
RWAASGSGVGGFRGFGSPEAEFEFDGGGRTAVLDRGRRVRGVLRLPRPVRRAGTTARIRVSDSFGRLLVDRTVSAGAGGERLTEIRVSLTIPAVIAQRHQLDIVVSSADGDTFASRSEFVYRLPAEWDDYLPALWHQPDPTNVGTMREMYLCGSQWLNDEPRPPDHFIDANYRYYVEHGFRNVFSPYHRRIKGEVAYYDHQARRAFLADRTDLRNLERNPCLSNPIIREEIDRLFAASARMHRDYRPLYYSIADEPGIADQAAPFDFCFSPWCREAFVKWLRKRYGTLGKLNRQWGTAHARWEEIRGGLTDEAIAAGDENYSAWCDHREFMDTILCDAYRLARDAVRREDPKGRLGMAGGQGPQAVGGWDFWKLCQVFDVHETYCIGNNYELMRSFAPEGIPFHTSWGPNDPHPNAERHAIWYRFIHGDRGLLLIRPRGCEYLDANGRYNANARRIMPLCRELSGGIGKLRIASQRVDDPIALYHSQANLRLHWIRQMRQVGLKWVHRTSSSERTDNRYVLLRESWVKVIEDNGLQYRFLCPPQVAAGGLKAYSRRRGEGFKVLLLPEILAMSAAEAAAIRRFVRAGGTVIADRLPGTFDEHGKRRRRSLLADLFDDGAGGRAVLLGKDLLPYYRQRLGPRAGEARLKGLIGEHLLGAVGRDRVTPAVTGPRGRPVTGVEVTVWRNGGAELIALH